MFSIYSARKPIAIRHISRNILKRFVYTIEMSKLHRVGDVTLVRKSGADLLNHPLFNKGTAFTLEERDRLGIRGLLPPVSRQKRHESNEHLKVQINRVLRMHRKMKVPLSKYQHLIGLQDRNEVLFYRLLIDNLKEFAPIIYTPTVGEACKQFGAIYRRARGMYFSSEDTGSMDAMVYNWPIDDVKLVVVTDGSRVLGLGDLGINGMGISIGKLSLYVAAAGIHPSSSLPIVVDVGTDNQELLNADLYMGLRHRRLKGEAYFRVMDEFIGAIQERWPDCLIQFEDFNHENALPILERYRDKVMCFNDDIQGTGAVTLAAILASLRLSNDKLASKRIVIVGAGTAGVGIAESIKFAMVKEGASEAEALKRFWFVDASGLLGEKRPPANHLQANYIRSDYPDQISLLETVKAAKPDILIGVSGVGGLFTQDIVQAVCANSEFPLIFPLSNPTTHAECTAQQVFNWTRGNCFFASGSPFDVIQKDNRTFHSNQANNMFTFPGIGLGAILCKARNITPDILHSASVELSQQVSLDEISKGILFPDIDSIRHVSRDIAVAVIQAAQRHDLAKNELPIDTDLLRTYVEDRMWNPRYGSTILKH